MKKNFKESKIQEIQKGSIYSGGAMEGTEAVQFLAEKSADLEQLRSEIEERLENMESILNECQRRIPELGQIHIRSKSYWLGSIQAMIRDAGSMTTFEDTLSEIQEAKNDYMHQEDQHDDECDCVTCLARREKGGLDYDPTNDNEEFEEHENQAFRDKGLDK